MQGSFGIKPSFSSMKVFYGKGEGCDRCSHSPVIGRLFFKGGEKSFYNEALLAVLDGKDDHLPEDGGCLVGIVRIAEDGEHTFDGELPYPSIILHELPKSYNGQVALLDPLSKGLFISPDLKTVNLYSRELFKKAQSKYDIGLFLPTGKRIRIYDRISPSASMTDSENGFVFELSKRAVHSFTEDKLYELYRDLAEKHTGLPMTLCIYGGKDFCKHLRAILRGAVYGRFSVLIRGVLSKSELTDILSLSSKTFCELEAEGREFNGYIPRGLCIDTPLLLYSESGLDGADFITFDIERLTRLLTDGRDVSESCVFEKIALDIKHFADMSRIERISAIIGENDISKELLLGLIECNTSVFYVYPKNHELFSKLLKNTLN